jgi:hypothetical protein
MRARGPGPGRASASLSISSGARSRRIHRRQSGTGGRRQTRGKIVADKPNLRQCPRIRMKAVADAMRCSRYDGSKRNDSTHILIDVVCRQACREDACPTAQQRQDHHHREQSCCAQVTASAPEQRSAGAKAEIMIAAGAAQTTWSARAIPTEGLRHEPTRPGRYRCPSASRKPTRVDFTPPKYAAEDGNW